MDEYLASNRELWNEWTDVHVGSAFYDVEGFRRGDIRIRDFEIREIGDVTGKDLLHLQCHFGIDTLSWVRLGARVTGADFSERAIQGARRLAQEVGLEARFLHSDLYALPEVLDADFDLVYTSRGVIPWLPDLRRWGEVIARFLRPGGIFYIAEGHPVMWVFDDEDAAPTCRCATRTSRSRSRCGSPWSARTPTRAPGSPRTSSTLGPTRWARW